MPTLPSPTLEVCCPTVDFARAAEAAGAGRVELCDNLAEGGTTPSFGAIEVAVARLAVPVMVMIRPRGGDFLYEPAEVAVMLRDIEAVAGVEAGGRKPHGVVVGALTRSGDIDAALTRELVAAARPLSVTFHRAFDLSRDLDRSLDTLLEIGVDRVLTSAGRPAVVDGLDTLRRLAGRAAGRLVVLPGGSIRADNAARVLKVPGIHELHIGASRWEQSPMDHRTEGVPMGRVYEPNEYAREVVDARRVAAIVRTMAEAGGPS
jgi:copper homeostasis protein